MSIEGLTALAVFGLAWLVRRSRWEAAAMAAWLLATAGALILQRPMWPRHHWSLVLWPLAILGGVAVGAAVHWARSSRTTVDNRRPGARPEGFTRRTSGPMLGRGAIGLGALALVVWALALPVRALVYNSPPSREPARP